MTQIIGEISNNHCGNRQLMAAMIEALADVGVDAAKFQSYRAHKLRKDYPDYEREYEYYRKHQLSEEDHLCLINKCEDCGIEFLTTVFDLDMVDMLARIAVDTVKIASPDANSWKMIGKCLDNFQHLIISTGMHSLTELDDLLNFIGPDRQRVTVLHCVSGYPIQDTQVNISRMEYIKDRGFNYGYSDHTVGTDAGKLAIAQGADVLECHFTLNKYLPGRDQFFAKGVDEMSELVKWNQQVELMTGRLPICLTEHEQASREKYCGRWGQNK